MCLHGQREADVPVAESSEERAGRRRTRWRTDTVVELDLERFT
jgi:hypothetical protein